MYKKSLVFLLLIVSCSKKDVNVDLKKQKQELDSLFRLTKTIDYSDSQLKRLMPIFLEKTEALSRGSLKNKYLTEVSNLYFNTGDIKNYFKICKKRREQAEKTQDTTALQKVYLDLGDYYNVIYKKDSAFYFYNKSFKKISDKKSLLNGTIMYRKAILMRLDGNIAESEILTTKALIIAKNKKDTRLEYDCYNNLGNVLAEYNDFEQAIRYHKKALAKAEQLKNDYQYVDLVAQSLNGMGVSYQKINHFKEAIPYFEQAIKKNSKTDKLLTALLLDNLSYSRFKLNATDPLIDFDTPLKIRIAENNTNGIIVSYTRKAEFFLKQNQIDKGLDYISKAKNLAQKSKNHREVLKLYNLLSEAKPSQNLYYKELYVNLKDSLLRVERKNREKLIRIEYETDEIIQDNQILARKIENTFIIGFILSLLTLVFFLSYRQRVKNNEIALIKEQQRNNAEIYQLMLDNQTKVSEGQHAERTRIAQDLHDGVLSVLMAIRMQINAMLFEKNNSSELNFTKQLSDLQKVETEIREISHNLKSYKFSNKENFIRVLEELIDHQKIIGNETFNVIIDPDILWEFVHIDVKINIYRIIQEAVYNAQKYAKATEISVSVIEHRNEEMRLIISDNGVGFDFSKAKKGIGVKNMQFRTQQIEGKIGFISNENGTTIEVKIPLNYEY